MIHRRLFLGGLLAGAAAPAIVRAASLMPIKAAKPITVCLDFGVGERMVIGEVGRVDGIRIIESRQESRAYMKAYNDSIANWMRSHADRTLLASMTGAAAFHVPVTPEGVVFLHRDRAKDLGRG